MEKGQHDEDQEADEKDEHANEGVRFNPPDGPPEPQNRVHQVLD